MTTVRRASDNDTPRRPTSASARRWPASRWRGLKVLTGHRASRPIPDNCASTRPKRLSLTRPGSTYFRLARCAPARTAKRPTRHGPHPDRLPPLPRGNLRRSAAQSRRCPMSVISTGRPGADGCCGVRRHRRHRGLRAVAGWPEAVYRLGRVASPERPASACCRCRRAVPGNCRHPAVQCWNDVHVSGSSSRQSSRRTGRPCPAQP